jgi:hypothetical protein
LLLSVLRHRLILIVLGLATLACIGCGGTQAGGGAAATSATSPTGTRITVVGDSQNHYPTSHINRVDCGNPGAADAFLSFVLPAAPPPSSIQGEMLINVTGTRATALNALYTLFTSPTMTVIGRTGSLGPFTLQSTGIRGQDGTTLAQGTLTISGNYICP